MKVTAYDLAGRFTGIKETPGKAFNPAILAMLQLDQKWPDGDEVAWCSAFANYVAWLLRLPRSKDLRARSWLNVGLPVHIEDARPGFDVVILKRGNDDSGPEVIDAPGHVGFFAALEGEKVLLLGGNQSDSVCVAGFDRSRVLGVRRLWEPDYTE